MPFDLRDRAIVITGGTGALGSAVAGLLLESGATCHISCLDKSELSRFPHRDHRSVRISEGVDLASESSVEGFYSRVRGASGGEALWASIHIAGGFAMSPIEKTPREQLTQMLDTNAITCFLCCREAVKAMRQTSAGGRIVNVAARPGLIPELGAGMVAYTASKAAVVAITRALAAEVAPHGIWVNAVAPSAMDTPANRKSMPNADHASWPKVEQVAATVAFLASPENAVTRGAVVPVYGKT